MPNDQQISLLIADTDDEHSSILTEFLMEEGFHVERVRDSDQTLSIVKAGRAKIVLLDISDPSGSGFELLRDVRQADSDVCVISMTTHPSVEGSVRSMKLRSFDYLQKPVKLPELADSLQSAIAAKGLQVDIETRLNEVIGTCVRELRSKQSLTLKQVANRTGLSVSLISQIELGKSAASLSTLHKLATALRVPMTHFFESV
ncbi:response regulator [Myxococcota bacterium]|nr:response regulator [Myxococcota bacterium]